ncbi:RsfA family transcriptional regulator [Virgibacillus alimentarius]|uniref:RsfA family transcription factor n=1 Tax=Virgibacillus alimentarius TaxID=698769 RepID=A0ABS4S528_9BACI|nr:RsfA family transcriptional regulator [Virgibacillus alimentarius]MBP2256100.1 RsfA family transcription factor [Virgibacillus alimentarius]
MNVTRQDAWSNDEDLLLAETVLRYISEGKTQLEAFKEVAKQLSRTSAACGFRWNATIRKQYQDAITLAKKERRDGSNQLQNEGFNTNQDRSSIDTAILLLEKMKNDYIDTTNKHQIEQEKLLEHLKSENAQLKEQLTRYDDAWTEMGNLWNWVKKNNHV